MPEIKVLSFSCRNIGIFSNIPNTVEVIGLEHVGNFKNHSFNYPPSLRVLIVLKSISERYPHCLKVPYDCKIIICESDYNNTYAKYRIKFNKITYYYKRSERLSYDDDDEKHTMSIIEHYNNINKYNF